MYTHDQRVEYMHQICNGLMDGQSLRTICSADDMPDKATVLRWMIDAEQSEDANEQQFATMIARARELQAEAKFDDMDDIMGDLRVGKLDPNQAKTLLWGIQWQLARLRPRKYGDKIQQEVSGPGGGPVQSDTRWTVEFVNPSNRDDDHKAEAENGRQTEER